MHTRVFISKDKSRKYVLFYNSSCVFSNFYPAEFMSEPIESFIKLTKTETNEKMMKFKCSEQFFMYHKALLVGDEEIAEKILNERQPKQMKLLGRMLKMSKEQLEQWPEIPRVVMHRACLEKFSQNEKCRELLFRTHAMRLVEAALNDTIWGIGLDKLDKCCENEKHWRGSNWLGEVLDKVRDELWARTEFKAEREQIEIESLETRCQLLENFSS